MTLIKNHNHNQLYTLIAVLFGIILILGAMQVNAVNRIYQLEFEVNVINARLDLR